MYQTEPQKKMKDFFKNHPDREYSAKELIAVFEKEMDKATVYRQLNLLEESFYIQKNFNMRKNGYQYRYSLECQNHMHLICEECGKIFHLNCQMTTSFLVHLNKDHFFQANPAHSTVYGRCGTCRKC